MTRSPETQALIEKAMAIIGPAADQDLVARGVMETRGYVKRSSKTFIASGYYGEVTTNHKKAAQRMAAALRRLQHALRDSNLVRRYDDLREDELERWRQRYQEAALKPGLSRAYRALNHAQYVAAKGAAALLQKHHLPLFIGRNSQFVKLAGLLFGREGADMRVVCRKVRDQSAPRGQPRGVN
jgi:hypothetical protein